MIWSSADINWNENDNNYEGLFFKEISIGDGLVTAATNDQNYWADFTSATDLWENFTSATWNGTVFTEVT
jgi:hypothetical protein